jgi:nicotinate-nucleotide adenylyltransferase
MNQHPPAGQRIAFFGGSFDPPHRGHLAVAHAARAALALDTVLFAPVGAQPLKPQGTTAGFDDRVEMTYTLETLLRLRAELAPGGTLFCLMGADSFFGLKRWRRSAEIPFVAPLIVASRPGQPLDDLYAALPPGLTMESAAGSPPISGPKAANAVEVNAFHLRNPAGETAPFFLLPGLHIEISASQIRDLIRGGLRDGIGDESQAASESRLSRQHLLPIPVLDYIRARGLYR